MTTDQILIGLGLTVFLAVGSQVVASRLRLPAIIVLLPVGFVAGALTSDVNPSKLLGSAFQPVVSLAVALILYDAGLGLDLRKLNGHTRSVVWRLIALGVPVSLALAAWAASLLLGLPAQAALMTGAILVVSGPTVVGPLLAFVRPGERVQRILAWEGSLIDPVGAILGAVVFHGIAAGTQRGSGAQLGQFLASVGIGLAGGAVGIALLFLVLRVLRLGEVLGTTAQLAAVIAVAAACDVLRDDTGLIAAIVMGLAAANMRGFDIPARRPFFETLVQLTVGLLFISISATVTPASVRHLVLPTVGLVAVLVLVARPLLTGEPDFDALASTMLAGNVDGPVYRLRPRQPGHGVVAPYTGGKTLFGTELTGPVVVQRYRDGAHILARRAGDPPSAAAPVLFVIRADGQLVPVTEDTTPARQDDDTAVLFVPQQATADAAPVAQPLAGG